MVAGLHPKKNLFKLDSLYSTSMFFGDLVPIYTSECVPGDVFSIKNVGIVRTQPLMCPVFQDMQIKTYYFFVPTRLIDEDFCKFIDDNYEDDETPHELPLIEDYYNNDSSDMPEKYSLWDYLGYPMEKKSTPNSDPDKEFLPLAYEVNAYNLIWNEYFRDEDITEERSLNDLSVAKVRWKDDYFTSVLKDRVKGTPPAFEWSIEDLLSNARVAWDYPPLVDVMFPSTSSSSFSFAENSQETFNKYVLGSSSGDWSINQPIGQFYNLPNDVKTFKNNGVENSSFNGLSASITPNYTMVLHGGNNWYADQSGEYSRTSNILGVPVVRLEDTIHNLPNYTYLNANGALVNGIKFGYPGLNNNYITGLEGSTQSFGFDISELRYNIQVQKYLELLNRVGSRYTEFIQGFFGVNPGDVRTQRPEFIGSLKSSIQIDEIPQTSAQTDGTTPQGTLKGKGTGSIVGKVGKYRVKEFGYIIGVMAITPSPTYRSQGFNRSLLRRDRFDFYNPMFSHLSEQEVKTGELVFTGDATSSSVRLGFRGIYDEYRTAINKVTGDMRDDLSYWHMARDFDPDNPPTLNDDFVYIDGRNDETLKVPFAVSDQPPFLIDIVSVVTALRPMPIVATPSI